MKRILSGLAVLAGIIMFSGPTMIGCTKTQTKHDTTIKNDTTVVVDTLKPPPGDTSGKHIKDSLWAYYQLNGNLADSSGNNHALSIVGSGINLGFDMWGNSQGALDFSGVTTSYAEIADGANFNAPSFTISLFAMYRQTSGMLFEKINWADATGGSMNIGIDPNNFLDTMRYSINTVSSPCTMPQTLGQNLRDPTQRIQMYAWYHVVVTFANDTMKLYMNGSLVNSVAYPNGQVVECGSSPFILGNWWSGDTRPFMNGKIDEIRIYTRALKPAEISYLYNNFQTR